MTTWTRDTVAHRFSEAVSTLRRLPGVRLQGYATFWPSIKRERWERLALDDRIWQFAAAPDAIDRLDVTLRWLTWLVEEQRLLVWMRAEERRWRDICLAIGCDRTTAWRRWTGALDAVARHLNDVGSLST